VMHLLGFSGKTRLWAAILVCAFVCNQPATAGGQLTEDERKELAAAVKEYKKSHVGRDDCKLIRLFPSLPPDEKVKLWLTLIKRHLFGDQVVRDTMLIWGVDAAPVLTDIVRRGKGMDRTLALMLLCDMDRFVPHDQFPFEELHGSVRDWTRTAWSEKLEHGGEINRFAPIDGRRIGVEARNAVYWAAEQTDDTELRFHAREHTGLFLEDLRKWPTEHVVKQWVRLAAKARQLAALGFYTDVNIWIHQCQMILMERPKESIPAVTAILRSSRDPFVRDRAEDLLLRMDRSVVRLRRTEDGRKAIEALRARYRRSDLAVFERPQAPFGLASIHERILLDKDPEALMVSDFTQLMAIAFEQYYGEVTRSTLPPEHTAKSVNPEVRRFGAYLSWVDPWYPSWEFTDCRGGRDAVFHPAFKGKMARYYQVWKEFKARGFVLPEAALPPAPDPEYAEAVLAARQRVDETVAVRARGSNRVLSPEAAGWPAWLPTGPIGPNGSSPWRSGIDGKLGKVQGRIN